jgi:hypothetical protein
MSTPHRGKKIIPFLGMVLLWGLFGCAHTVERGIAAYNREDYTTALRELQAFAQQGNVIAQVFLGLMYAEGRGVAKDDAKAMHWLRQAAAQGNALAQAGLGVMYKEGRGVARDPAEARRLFAQAQPRFDKAAETLPPGRDRDAAIQIRDMIARELATTPAPLPSSVTPPPTANRGPTLREPFARQPPSPGAIAPPLERSIVPVI